MEIIVLGKINGLRKTNITFSPVQNLGTDRYKHGHEYQCYQSSTGWGGEVVRRQSKGDEV